MKSKWYFALCMFFSVGISFCQSGNPDGTFNFGFEKRTPGEKLPDSWFIWGSGYSLTIDTLVRKSGNASVLIKPIGQKTADDFGCIAYGIPAIYEGREIELRASMKYMNVTDGNIGLLLRIDGDAGQLGFDNMQQKDIHGTSDWTVFSVKLPYPEGVKMIYIGSLLSGTGQLWVDDFEVYIDGIEIQHAAHKKLEIYKADEDTAFDGGSGIADIGVNEKVVLDLTALGKLWGFLKYYHPAVAKGDYNWDYELFRILPKVLSSRDLKERNMILLEWVNHLGEFSKDLENKPEQLDIKLTPDLSWMDHSDFDEPLVSKLKEIMHAERKESHYYIGLTSYVGNPDFKHEKPYTEMKYPDIGFRLLSLYRYWNVIAYYFPYRYLIGENWDDVLKEFIPEFINASSELEYKQTVLALIARVHDTHANIWGQDSILRNYRGINYAPLDMTFIGDTAVVKGYYNDLLGEQTGLKAGDVIESINHVPVREIIRMKLPYTPASNYPTQLRTIANNLLRTNDTLLVLGCRRNDMPFTAQVKCYGNKEMNPYQKFMVKDTCFKVINGDIAYIYPGSIQNEYLPGIKEEASKTNGLIIDLRCYPSAFIVFSLGEYLLPEPTDFVKFSKGSVISPGVFTLGEMLQVGRKNDDHYKGKIVILVNEQTQSQAEYTAMALRTAPGAIVIGSTTAGADGNVSQFYLPGGISTMISGIGIYYPDGRETQRIGIVPDIVVKPTIRGIQEGRDEVLEQAIELIR